MRDRRRRGRRWLGSLLVAGVLALSACGGGGGGATTGSASPSAGEVTLQVSGAEFSFTPNSLTAPADTAVTVHFTNSGTIEHNLTIDEGNLAVTATPGEMQTGTFALPAGAYTFYCSVPGHQAAGMEGTLTVS